ncbi:hypothetical protein Rcae01_00937 [Novipirellula caenicola]|uniref:Uncharacterized protein n=1 Tax=Novipirellula caenicola TaxID=1536901 RepID=A0ABP9VP28_9BACT
MRPPLAFSDVTVWNNNKLQPLFVAWGVSPRSRLVTQRSVDVTYFGTKRVALSERLGVENQVTQHRQRWQDHP